LGRKLSERFPIGSQGKSVRETISGTKGTAQGIEVGTQYQREGAGRSRGMAITNSGTKMKGEGTEGKVETDCKAEQEANRDANAEEQTEEGPKAMSAGVG
jgi:hypothetical protein